MTDEEIAEKVRDTAVAALENDEDHPERCVLVDAVLVFSYLDENGVETASWETDGDVKTGDLILLLEMTKLRAAAHSGMLDRGDDDA